jgi:hypothetical protein
MSNKMCNLKRCFEALKNILLDLSNFQCTLRVCTKVSCLSFNLLKMSGFQAFLQHEKTEEKRFLGNCWKSCRLVKIERERERERERESNVLDKSRPAN